MWEEVGDGVNTLLQQVGTVWVGVGSSWGCKVGRIRDQPGGHCPGARMAGYWLVSQVVAETRKGSRSERRPETQKVIKVYTKPECGMSTLRA